MSDFEFVIPLQKDELLESHIGQYHVEDVVQQRVLAAKLQEAVRAYNNSGVDFIFEHFDTYFSILVHGNKLEWISINKGFEYVERACQQLCGHLEGILQNKEIDPDTRARTLNCLKMLLYLHTSLMKVKDSKLQAEMAATLTLGKRGRKAANTDNLEKEGEWKEVERRTALDVLYNLLQLPLHRFWDPPLADDTFVDMVAQPCYRAMEDASIKNKTTRETVFQVLGILNKQYNHGLSCTIKLVQMVQLYEHAVLPICAGVAQLVTSCGLAGLVARLVREVGEALGGSEGGALEGAGDSAPAQRNCALLLAELTQLLPGHMIPAAQAMRCYLDNDECYPLRCSVLGMMCEILCRELKGEGQSEERRIMRDDFLDDLEEHLHDLSAYVRSRVLQNWCRLQREGCVPVVRQQRVLARAIGRLQDKATLVRKNAVQLLKVFIEHNPFSAQLKLNILEEELVKERGILETVQQQLNTGPDPELEKEWNKIKDDIKKVVEGKIDQLTQDDPSLSQGTVNDAYATIRKLLHEEKFFDAFMVIRHAERMYPEAKLLRCKMDKKDQISYFIALLHNVFVTDNKSRNMTEVEEAELITKLQEKENVVAFLEESIGFSKLVQQAVPLVYTLLMSKQATDVYEAIDFFTTAHSFNIETANLGIMGMLQLVWSPDQEKKDAVEKAYRQMYLSCEGGTERTRAGVAATRLLKLVRGANRGHAAALQALLARWMQQDDVGPPLIQVLWEIFTKKHEEATEENAVAALSLLVMLAKAKSSVASANIEIIQTFGLKGNYNTKVLSMQLLLTIGKSQKRLPTEAPLLQSILDTIVESFFKMEDFMSLGTNTIDVFYVLCDTPDLICVQLLKEITQKMHEMFGTGDSEMASYPVEYLSRLLVLLGHIALQQLIHLDVTVYGELRRRNEIREQRKIAGAKNNVGVVTNHKSGRVGELSFNTSSASSASSRLRPHNVSHQDAPEGEEEDEAGLEGAVADDADAELVRAVCEAEVVGGGAGGAMAQDALLARIAPLLRSLLVPNSTSATPDKLRAAACLALGRFMLVSSTFCEDHMQLLMTILKNSTSSSVRCNIIMTLADLTLRFPNVIQPWTHFIYERLEDSCVEVRQCTVKMLSYLILQEMVRVRGQVAALARRCVDPDPSTRTMARLFFKQLAHKGNSLYNVIPDIISRLSDPDLQLPEDDFRTIIKYVMSLIQKDRQMEALVEKLCLRFKLSNIERQWRDLAYCLCIFTYNERSVKKLIENLDCYKDKLFHKEVYECFKIIITNAGKMAKADLKAAVSELNDKIEECFAVQEAGALGDGGDEVEVHDKDARRTEQPQSKGNARRAPNRRPRQRKSNSSGDSDDDGPSDSENGTPVKSRTKPEDNVRTSARKRAPPQKYQQENDSDESDEEDFQEKRNVQKNDVFKKPSARAGRKRK